MEYYNAFLAIIKVNCTGRFFRSLAAFTGYDIETRDEAPVLSVKMLHIHEARVFLRKVVLHTMLHIVINLAMYCRILKNHIDDWHTYKGYCPYLCHIF